MQKLQITVTGADAVLTEKPLLTAGTVGLQAAFTFDDSWAGLQKTAVFRAGGTTVLCRNIEEQTLIPWEVLQKAGCTLYAGVYGLSEDGAVAIPTVWVSVGLIQPGADPAGTEGCDPQLPVWQQALDASALALEIAQGVREDALGGLFDGPQGEEGPAGYSPVRGIDYWTEGDQDAIKSYVDDAILGGSW